MRRRPRGRARASRSPPRSAGDRRAHAQLQRARRPVADSFGFRAEQASIASSIISEIASAAAGSGSPSRPRAVARAPLRGGRAGARRRRSRRQLHAKAHRVGRRERDALEQVGVALGKRPWAASARARASSSPMRCSAGAARAAGERGAEPRAALAGARRIAAVPASVSTATAARSPWRAANSTWCARAAAGAPRSARTRAQRSCAPSSHPPGALSYTARRTSGWRKRKRRGHVGADERGRGRGARRTPPGAVPSSAPAAAAASSGSNGSPATAAPRRTRRVSSESRPSSSAERGDHRRGHADGLSAAPARPAIPPAPWERASCWR